MPDTPVTLRRATTADADAVRDLTRSAYAGWVDVLGREPLPMLADYAHAVEAHRIDCLWLDGILQGLIETAEANDHLLVVNVAIRPGMQRRGLGRGLLAHAEDVATSLGLIEMRLYTNVLMTSKRGPLPEPRLSRGSQGSQRVRRCRPHEQALAARPEG